MKIFENAKGNLQGKLVPPSVRHGPLKTSQPPCQLPRGTFKGGKCTTDSVGQDLLTSWVGVDNFSKGGGTRGGYAKLGGEHAGGGYPGGLSGRGVFGVWGHRGIISGNMKGIRSSEGMGMARKQFGRRVRGAGASAFVHPLGRCELGILLK